MGNDEEQAIAALGHGARRLDDTRQSVQSVVQLESCSEIGQQLGIIWAVPEANRCGIAIENYL